jgi:hypothetical protein
MIILEGRPPYSSVARPMGPGRYGGLRYNEVMEYRNPFEWTPQSEAWVEAASWIAEEKRARLRDDPTAEAFARLAFQLCMQQTQETDAH